MANKRMGGEGLDKRMDEGVHRRSASDEGDVEGHVFRRSDEAGAIKRSSPDGATRRMDEGAVKRSESDEDDVEGHMIGTMNPTLARELARAKERDIQRSVSRSGLINDAKRALRRKD